MIGRPPAGASAVAPRWPARHAGPAPACLHRLSRAAAPPLSGSPGIRAGLRSRRTRGLHPLHPGMGRPAPRRRLRTRAPVQPQLPAAAAARPRPRARMDERRRTRTPPPGEHAAGQARAPGHRSAAERRRRTVRKSPPPRLARRMTGSTHQPPSLGRAPGNISRRPLRRYPIVAGCSGIIVDVGRVCAGGSEAILSGAFLDHAECVRMPRCVSESGRVSRIR
jgi:hypothetical protein